MMNEDEAVAMADDNRRAAALIAHYGRGDLEGINAVLEETGNADRVSEMVMALLRSFHHWLPELRTELGQHVLSDQVMKCAGFNS